MAKVETIRGVRKKTHKGRQRVELVLSNEGAHVVTSSYPVKIKAKIMRYTGVDLAAFSDEVGVRNKTGRKKIKRATGRSGYELAKNAYKISGGVTPELRRMWQEYQEDRDRYRQVVEQVSDES
ncbi:hypothetical protein [Pseudochelatococcus contaminans]|uniref:Uncharacterized protein n=1 Tax=Pseudochelatococcus contaminans TaxID=1538103 RepID=A0A7W6EJ57_9HYPH|nr:hypothetical protein [Pseudochelatococcus contaminans]MBB3811462.1 hypothetical protein [Pseudochelatococcus contaminans]